MKEIKAKIVAYIRDDQPGFVACEFVDAWGKLHRVEEKVPVVTLQDLDQWSEYPVDGFLGCEVLKAWTDGDGRELFRVTTDRPWGIETVDGEVEFDVYAEQLVELGEAERFGQKL